MVQLTLSSENERGVLEASKRLYDKLVAKIGSEYGAQSFVVYGPFEAQVYKLNEKYRMKMILKCRLTRESRRLFHELLCEFSNSRKASLAVDINPLGI